MPPTPPALLLAVSIIQESKNLSLSALFIALFAPPPPLCTLSHPTWMGGGNRPFVGSLLKPVISRLLGLQSGGEGGGTTEDASAHSPVAVFTNQANTVGALQAKKKRQEKRSKTDMRCCLSGKTRARPDVGGHCGARKTQRECRENGKSVSAKMKNNQQALGRQGQRSSLHPRPHPAACSSDMTNKSPPRHQSPDIKCGTHPIDSDAFIPEETEDGGIELCLVSGGGRGMVSM